ncbi:MAG: hypothetical protein RIG84_11670 [Roseovarius sp.]
MAGFRMAAALAALALAAGCGGEAPSSRGATGGGHAALLASLGTNYAWDCTLEAADRRSAPWRFVLTREVVGGYAEVRLLDAARSGQQKLVENRDGAAFVYRLDDGSRMVLTVDGEVVAEGNGRDYGALYPSGRCQPGPQMAGQLG